MRFIVTRVQPLGPPVPEHFAEFLYNTALKNVNKRIQDRTGMFSPLNDPSAQHARQVRAELIRLIRDYNEHRKHYDQLQDLSGYATRQIVSVRTFDGREFTAIEDSYEVPVT